MLDEKVRVLEAHFCLYLWISLLRRLETYFGCRIDIKCCVPQMRLLVYHNYLF